MKTIKKFHGCNLLSAEMAEIALKYKVDGIVVSNHGARQLDGVPATVSAFGVKILGPLRSVVLCASSKCESFFKANHYDTRGITPKRVMNGGVHLR